MLIDTTGLCWEPQVPFAPDKRMIPFRQVGIIFSTPLPRGNVGFRLKARLWEKEFLVTRQPPASPHCLQTASQGLQCSPPCSSLRQGWLSRWETSFFMIWSEGVWLGGFLQHVASLGESELFPVMSGSLVLHSSLEKASPTSWNTQHTVALREFHWNKGRGIPFTLRILSSVSGTLVRSSSHEARFAFLSGLNKRGRFYKQDERKTIIILGKNLSVPCSAAEIWARVIGYFHSQRDYNHTWELLLEGTRSLKITFLGACDIS